MALVSAAAAFLVWPSLPSGNPIKTKTGGEGWAMDLADCVGIGAFAVIGMLLLGLDVNRCVQVNSSGHF